MKIRLAFPYEKMTKFKMQVIRNFFRNTNLIRTWLYWATLLFLCSFINNALFAVDQADLSWNTIRASVATPFGAAEIQSMFPYVNHCRFPITIDAITSACSCTSGYGAGDVCPPGGSGSIRVFVNTENLRGVQDRSVTVTYHLGADRVHICTADLHTITNVASTDACASWDRRFLQWDRDSPSIPRICIFTVHQVQPIHILSCHVLGVGFPATVHEVTPGRVYEVRVTPDSTVVLKWARVVLTSDAPIPVLASCNISAMITDPPMAHAATKQP